MPEYFDVHCHLQNDSNLNSIDIQSIKTNKMAVMATNPDDWPIVAELATKYPDRIVPGFGIHPWLINSAKQHHQYQYFQDDKIYEMMIDWKLLLVDYLKKFPNGIVGEIGLDKIAKDRNNNNQLFDFQEQTELFEYQLDLAFELNRPVSVHSVKCCGTMFEIFQNRSQRLPKKVKLHSYSGSVDSLKRFLKFNLKPNPFYFSFSKIINCKTPKYKETLKLIPLDKLLIESDNDEFSKVDPLMDQVATLIEEIHPNSLDHIYLNSLNFYNLIDEQKK